MYQHGLLVKMNLSNLLRLQGCCFWKLEKLIKTIHAKIRNSRKDWNHKVSTKLVKNAKMIVIGDIESQKLMQTKLAKSVSDVAWVSDIVT